MARNGSGEYSLPANTTAVSGATISSTKFNSIMSDIESTLNTARPVVKGGTGATTASAARTNLGLAIGTDVQAYDAGLASIAGLTTAADKMIYTTALDTYAVADLSAFARTILDDADASAVRTTIGAGTGSGDLLAANNLSDLGSASTARSNLGLGALAVLGSVNNDDWSGTDLAVANGGTGASDAATARSNLGLGTMAVEAAADYAALSGAAFTGDVDVTGLFTVDETTTGADIVLGIGNATISNALQAITSDGNLVWGFNVQNSRNFVIQTNQTERVRVDSSGNVGIGTTSPGSTLDVDGTFQAKGFRNATVSGTLTADNHGRGQVNQVSGNITLAAMENASHGVLINNSGTPRTITASGVTMYVNQTSVSSATLAGRGLAGFVYEGSTVVHINGAVS